MVKFQHATSAWLVLPYDHCLVSLLFPDVPVIVVGTAIPTSDFIFLFYVHTCIPLFVFCLYLFLKVLMTISQNKVAVMIKEKKRISYLKMAA